MLDFPVASDRAVHYAIETGKMPNIHLIHTIQRTEGYEPCFARATAECPRTHCRWFHECMALASFRTNEYCGTVAGPNDFKPMRKSLTVLRREAIRPYCDFGMEEPNVEFDELMAMAE